MKKLLLALACVALLAPAAMACPGMDHHDDQAPKTAEKKEAPAKKDEAKAKDSNKDQKPATDTAKTKDGEKKPDKVSAK